MTYKIPDFRAQAKIIYYAHISVDDIEQELRHMFLKGLEMGHKVGYSHGDTTGWVAALELDKDFQENANKKT